MISSQLTLCKCNKVNVPEGVNAIYDLWKILLLVKISEFENEALKKWLHELPNSAKTSDSLREDQPLEQS